MSATDSPKLQQSQARGIIYMLLASLAFAVMGALVKTSTRHVSFFTVVFVRSAVIVVVAFGLARLRRAPLRARNRRLMLWRSVSGFAAMCCYFFAVSVLPLAVAITIQYTAPLFVALLSGLVLHERVSPRGFVLVAVAFSGAALVLSPELDGLSAGLLAGITSAVLAAFAYLAVRGLRGSEQPETIVFQFAVFSSIASSPALFVESAPPSLADWVALVGVGLFATAGQLGITWAFRYADAAFVSAFSYATIVFGAVIGVAIFAEPLAPHAALGSLIVVSAGAALSLLERKP